MRVITFARFEWNGSKYVCVEQRSHGYDGPWAQCGGGPSDRQKQAADQQAQISQQELQVGQARNAREQKMFDLASPFEISRMKGGLPEYGDLMDFEGGPTARSFIPVRAAEGRREAMGGSNMLPSGFHDAAMRDIDEAEAHQFDDNLFRNVMANEQVKEGGAGAIMGEQQMANPLSFYAGSEQGYGNIANNPQLAQSNPLAAILGGVMQGAQTGLKAASVGGFA